MQSHQRTAQRKRQTYKSCITNIKWKKPLKTYSHSSPFEKFLPTPPFSTPWHLSLSGSWLHMQMKLKVRDASLSRLCGLFRKRCSRLFSNYKSKTLMRASPLLSTMSLSPCPSGIIQSVSHGSSEEIFPNSKSNWNWKMQMNEARQGDEAETCRRC